MRPACSGAYVQGKLLPQSPAVLLLGLHGVEVGQRSPTFLAPGTGFVENDFSTDRGGGDGSGGNTSDRERWGTMGSNGERWGAMGSGR